ncbi:hypothetical protein AB0H12_36900 [Actinosynnema sp. NPDC023794]
MPGSSRVVVLVGDGEAEDVGSGRWVTVGVGAGFAVEVVSGCGSR